METYKDNAFILFLDFMQSHEGTYEVIKYMDERLL